MGNNETVKNILKYTPYLIDLKDNLGNTALHYAEQNSSEEIIETINYYKKTYNFNKSSDSIEEFISKFNTPVLEEIKEK